MTVVKKSILTDIINDIYTATDLDLARKLATQCINDSKINKYSKMTILSNLKNIQTLEELQIYITNSMFKKLGMGV